jgi:multidrug resistance efflux pump
LREQIELLRIASPIEGIVTTPSVALHEKLGQHVNQGDLIAEVYELRTITAEIAVSEKEIADVRRGGRVVVRARAYPHLSFEGKVDSIAAATGGRDPSSDGGPGSPLPNAERTILVRTQIDNASLLLLPGMTGTAKISCGERQVFDLLTRRVARYLRVEFWSWW